LKAFKLKAFKLKGLKLKAFKFKPFTFKAFEFEARKFEAFPFEAFKPYRLLNYIKYRLLNSRPVHTGYARNAAPNLRASVTQKPEP
jgi:hypothetical protein